MELEKVKKIFSALYDNVNGKALSLKGREDQEFKSKSYVYGEVVPDSFYQLIKEADPQPGQVFCDFGSGTGKAVLLAHLLFNFSKSFGVELVDTLYDASKEVEARFKKEFEPNLYLELGNKEMELLKGNFLQTDISNVGFLFMNSTCFQEDLMKELEKKLEELPPHAQVISLSKGFRTPAFYQYKHKLFEFSWGQATAFFHRKRLWNFYE